MTTNNTEKKNAPEAQVRDISQLDAVVKAQAIKAAASFAGKDKSRLILTAVKLEAARNRWRLVATDGYRLAILETEDPGAEAVAIHIDAAAASKAIKTSDDNVQFLEVDGPAKLVKVAIFNKKRQVRLEYWPIIDGQFPDYKKLEPAAAPDVLAAAVSINPEYLASAGKLVNTALGSTAPMVVSAQSPAKPLGFWASGEFRIRGLIMPRKDDELASKWSKTSSAGEAARIKEAADKARSEGWQAGYEAGLASGAREAEKKLTAEYLEKLEHEKNDAAEAHKEAEKRAKAVNIPPAPKAPETVIAEKLAEDPARAEGLTSAEKLAAVGVHVVNVSGPEPVVIASPEKLAEKLEAVKAPEKPEAEAAPKKPSNMIEDSPELAALREQFPELAFYQKKGGCVWCGGDTKPRRQELKEAGFKWSDKRQEWYRKPAAA